MDHTYGQSTDRISFYGAPPISQRSNALQATAQARPVGQFITYQWSLSPSAVNPNTTVESTFAESALLANDFILSVNKPTTQAGIGIAGWRTSTGTLAINFGNSTSVTTTPTASETYTVVVARGLPVISQALNPAAVAANTAVEQIFTIEGSGATATALINSSGQVIGANVTAGGSGYFTPPEVVFSGGGPDPTYVQSGTATGLDSPAATGSWPYGTGATGIAIVSGGAVIGVRITNPGSGYQTAPNVSFSGGNNIALGMTVVGSKPTAQTGLGVGNWRVAGNYQVGITFENFTGSAITPTAGEVYSFVAVGPVPGISNEITYGAAASTPGATVGATTTSEQAISITGVTAAVDWVVGISKPSAQTGLGMIGARVSSITPNAVYADYINITAGAITPTPTEVYTVVIGKTSPPQPAMMYEQYVSSFTAVSANTGGEQQVTVTGVPAGSAVNVMPPPGMPAGLVIGASRVSAANTVQVNFVNATAGSLTPPVGVYAFENFPVVGPGAGNWAAVPVSPSLLDVLNLSDEQQQLFNVNGLMAGS